jgi:NAD(P)-dependent dehydrogenase (short-subunit alcohol dehydrogenase family)
MATDAPLAGQVAVVTGAGRGIGRATALRLVELGAKVLCVARTASQLNETVALARIGAALAFPMDICADGAARAIVDAALAKLGRLDILVHSAGVIRIGSMEEVSLADLDRSYQVNIRGPYALTQAALPALKANHGQIIFVNSSIIRAANIGGRGVFAATQAALKAIADSVRDEMNSVGIRVLSVMPGNTATPRQEALHVAEGKTYRPDLLMQAEDVAEVACATLLLPRTAEATDLFLRPMLKC